MAAAALASLLASAAALRASAAALLAASPRARLALSAARTLLPSICLYGAALLWYSASDMPLRQSALALTALLLAAEIAAALSARTAALLILAILACAIGASAGAAPAFWEAVVILSALLWLILRWQPTCCGSSPTCCCVCACPPRKPYLELRAVALPGVLALLLLACAAVLLLPALAAQLSALSCLPPEAVATGARVFYFDRLMSSKPAAGAGAGNAWQPSDGSRLLRASRDDNASYALWIGASRELFFAGTHTSVQLLLDLAVTPRTLAYAGGRCSPVTVHGGFYRAFEFIREQVLEAVSGALAENASAAIIFYGFSLGGAMAPLAALDLACSGVVPAEQLSVLTMGGPGICTGDGCAAVLGALQRAGLQLTRIVNPFDFITWLPPGLYDPLKASQRSHLSFTPSGSYMLAAHQSSGYLPSEDGGCARLRALAWVPVTVAAALAAACAAADSRVRADEGRRKAVAAARAAQRGAEGQGVEEVRDWGLVSVKNPLPSSG